MSNRRELRNDTIRVLKIRLEERKGWIIFWKFSYEFDLRIEKLIMKLMILRAIEEDWENDTVYSIRVLKIRLRERKGLNNFLEIFISDLQIEKFIMKLMILRAIEYQSKRIEKMTWFIRFEF